MGDRSTNGRFAGARHATEPIYASSVWLLSPFTNLSQNFDAGTWITSRLVFISMVIESCTLNRRKLGENLIGLRAENTHGYVAK